MRAILIAAEVGRLSETAFFTRQCPRCREESWRAALARRNASLVGERVWQAWDAFCGRAAVVVVLPGRARFTAVGRVFRLVSPCFALVALGRFRVAGKPAWFARNANVLTSLGLNMSWSAAVANGGGGISLLFFFLLRNVRFVINFQNHTTDSVPV